MCTNAGNVYTANTIHAITATWPLTSALLSLYADTIASLTVVRLGLVAVVLDPPHRPVSNCLALEVESDGEEGEERHDAGVHAVGLHVSEFGGSGNKPVRRKFS